jgi:alkanesulfonate monooxygenase SsuD/methylene tetrahydromethanopterin reductase-like flavin-dependent oxidoreductase (luciferase family)
VCGPGACPSIASSSASEAPTLAPSGGSAEAWPSCAGGVVREGGCHLAGEVADGVLFNWLSPEHARVSGQWVREGAVAAGRQPPRLYAYVRVAIGAAGVEKLAEEAARYAAIPAYADHFTRMGVKPVETAVGAQNPEAVRPALAGWEGAVDELVVRAITAKDSVEENVALLQAAAPRHRSG